MLPGFSYQVIDHQWNYKNNTIYFTANKGATQQLFSLAFKNNRVIQNTYYNGMIKTFTMYTRTDRLIFQMCDPENPDDFYTADLKTWKTKRLTNTNPQTNNFAHGKYKTVTWKSNDGKEVEGILIYPFNYNPAKKYPLIIQLHGGPNSSYKLEYGLSWVTYPDVLSGKGYIILQPNYRGSAGYGDNFYRGIIGNFFKMGSEDILSGIDYLIKTGVIDETKIGIMGFSAGGHFTNWLITQTNKFKVASSGAGLSNWISFYAQTEVPYLRELWLGVNPYDDIEKCISLSPITYAHNVKTPTFFFCGDKDNRVPFQQTLEMYRALKRYNIPARLLVLPEEGHSIGDLKRQMVKMKSEFEWMEKYLK
jgi:dipeptidyl aminopeptidase/acylaminoacyl peptidase